LKTVVENRIGLDEICGHKNGDYMYPGEDTGECRSCFYDFGAEQRAKFVGFDHRWKSSFVEELKKQFLE
jgi:hypothetical protein